MRKVNYISIGAALIVFASVATALRFGKLPIGIGELAVILLFLWALRYRQALGYLTHPIMLFWIGFITIAGVAAFFSPLTGASTVHTAAAYVYTACFSLMALACIDKASQEEFNSFIRALGIVPVVLLAIPFLCFLTDSYELSELFGINTDYPSRLSAWSTNPNQLAVFLLPIPIWLMAVYRDSNWQGARWLRNFLLLWAFFFLGICVRSDALLLAWCIGLPLLTFVASLWLKRINWKMFVTMLAAFVLAFGSFKYMIDGPGREKLIAAENAIINTVSSIFTPTAGETRPKKIHRASAPGKSDSMIGVGFDQNKTGVRKTLWIHASEAWLLSPIIGHGPGAFSYLEDPAKKEEAHNLGFDMLTQVGIAGVLLFAALYLWLLVKAYQARDPYSLAVLIVLMVFSAAHFMLRQPVFSLYMIICALAIKKGSFTVAREKPQPI
ncbi:O-antigen ligase [Pseudomonas sp. R5(2019)]|uniref:O-antigen ligase family protein n=1 Tax=Pseudomonas sp. R5(2019) TaxID=2697566 RepID=UPI001412B2E7|nr:O-antigen ligase family protein [Pseudomonas sp. R5(2019)]NBA97275.1 hypothetical protein [Pseudomonas sp. R5(2019)]